MPRLFAYAVSSLAIATPGIALGQNAQDVPLPRASVQTDQDAAPDRQPPTAPAAAQLPDASGDTDWDYINTLGRKGWATPFPKMSDTALRDVGGVRSALADVGIGFLGLSKNTVQYNVRDYDGPAKYNGKNPTYSTGIQSLFLTFDTGKVGVKDGQIFLTLAAITNGLSVVNGPRYALRHKIDLKSPNILQSQTVRRTTEMATELRNCVKIGSLRRRRQVAQCHVVDHTAAQRVYRCRGGISHGMVSWSGVGLQQPNLPIRRPF